MYQRIALLITFLDKSCPFFGDRKMTYENSDKTKQVKEIVILFIGFVTLIFADSGVLRSFFGILLLVVLSRYLKEPYKFWDRVILSMSMSFAAIIACSYHLTSFLNTHGWALLEDKILISGLFIVTIFFFVLKSKCERRTVRGET